MSPAVVDFRSPITSPQLQSKHSSLPNPNPNPNPNSQTSSHPLFDFTSLSSNNRQNRSSSHTGFETMNSSNLGNASDGGFDNTFSSPAVSRTGSEKVPTSAAASGRSKPRLVKVRKQLGSQYVRSTAVSSTQIDPGFNPFRSVSESSGRVKHDNNSSALNGFNASIGDDIFGRFDNNVGFVFGAHCSDSVANSKKIESNENKGKLCSGDWGKMKNVIRAEFGKFDDVGFVFGANECDSALNLNSEDREPREIVEESVPDDRGKIKLEVGVEFEKFDDVGFVFGADKCDSTLNLNSKNRELGEISGNLGSDDREKMKLEVGEEFGKSVNVGFMFGADKCDSTLNLNLKNRECGEIAGESVSNGRGIGAEFGKLDNVGFVLGANQSDSVSNLNSEKRESSESARKLSPDDNGKMKIEIGAEFEKYDSVGFVFGANQSDSASNLNSEKREFRNGKLVCDDREKMKTEIGANSRKYGNEGFVFGVNQGDLPSNLNSGKIESSKNSGKSFFGDLEKMNVESETEFQKAKANGVSFNAGVFVFGSSNKESSGFDESMVIKFPNEMNELNGGKSGNCEGIGKTQNGNLGFDANDKYNFVFGSSSNKVSASGTSPEFKLPDEMKKMNINDSENIDGADKAKDSDTNSRTPANNIFVFRTSKKASGSSTGSSATNSSDQINNSNLNGPGSGDAVEKTNAVNLKTSDENNCIFGSTKKSNSSFGGGIENLMTNEMRNLNIRSGVADSNEQINLGCSSSGIFGKETPQPVNLNDKSFNDPAAAGISSPPPFTFQAGHDKSSGVGEFPQGPANDDTKLNGAASPSSSSSVGLGFQPNGGVFETSSTSRVEGKDGFSFTSTPDGLGAHFADFRPPKLDGAYSFAANLFPLLNKKPEFSAKSRSAKDKRIKKMKGKLRHSTLVQQLPAQDNLSREGCSQQNPESPGCYSPMDFSPYQEAIAADRCSRETSVTSKESFHMDNKTSNESFHMDNNCAPSAAHSTVSTDAKDQDLAAAGEGFDINEGDKKCREPNEKDSLCHCEERFAADTPLEEFVFGAETTSFSSETEQVRVSSGAGVASAEAGASFSSKTARQESNCGAQFCFASSLEDIREKKFTFSASFSAQGSSSAAKRQYRKKNRKKVGCDSPKVKFASASLQFSPLASTSPLLDVAKGQKGDISISQSKGENKSEGDEEQVKQGSISASAAIGEACEQWRLRGNQAYRNGDMLKAEDFYTRGVNLVPPSETSGFCLKPLVLCYSNRAITRMSLGRIRESLGDCMMAAALDPNFLKVQIRAANCHLVLGEVEDALQYFSKCLESGSDVCLDRRIIIEASDGLQKAQKVAECTNRSAELLQQRTSDAAVGALGIIAEALSISSFSEKLLEMKAEALCMLGKYEEVIQLCEQTLDFAEKNFTSVGTECQLANVVGSESKKNSFVRLWRWCLISKSYFHLGKLELALDLIEKLEQAGFTTDKYGSKTLESSVPLAVTVHELLRRKNEGNEAFQSGRHTEAVEHYTAALSSNVKSRPFAAICFCNRAAAYQALGQFADAIADCSLAIALDGNYPKAVSRRATLHEMIRDYGQAASDLQNLISVLEKQSNEKAKQSGTPGKPTGCVKELRQAHRRLSSMEEKAKEGTPLDLYLILGIKPSDTASEIKKAYRKAALKHHPDKAGQFLARSESGDDGRLWKEIAEEVHKDADRLFKMIGEAYAVLSDTTKRSEYDIEEEMRQAPKESNGSSTSRRPSDVHSYYPFERGYRRYSPETWKTYGNSHSRW